MTGGWAQDEYIIEELAYDGLRFGPVCQKGAWAGVNKMGDAGGSINRLVHCVNENHVNYTLASYLSDISRGIVGPLID